MFLFQFIYVIFLSVCWLAINPPQVYMCLAFLRRIFWENFLKNIRHFQVSSFYLNVSILTFARGFRGMLYRYIFKNGLIWCVLENILLKFCLKIFFFYIKIIFYKNN